MGSGLEVAVIGALLVVVLAAFACGRLAVAVGQPHVVGEMVAGLLLGPLLLGALAPTVQQQIFSSPVMAVLKVLSSIGLTYYMFAVGAGMQLPLRGGPLLRRAMALSASGLVVAFAAGGAAGVLWHRQLGGPGVSPGVLALVVGGALSITAFPVLARMLRERAAIGSQIAGLLLVAAAIDDVAAWNLLAVLGAATGIGARAGVLLTAGGVLLLAAAAMLGLRPVFGALIRHARRRGEVSAAWLTAVLLVVLVFGWAGERIGILAAFGGFLVGLSVPDDALVRRDVLKPVEDFTSTLFVPVFFAITGLTIVPSALGWSMLPPLAGLLAAAFLGKYVFCAITARMWGLAWRPSLVIGAYMNARGLMLLVFATAGLQAHLLSQTGFAMLIIVGVITTAAVSPLRRLSGERSAAPVGPVVPDITPQRVPTPAGRVIAGEEAQ